MLIVETIAKIRRAFFVQGKSIKAICRELRVSRKVVRKVIRSEATEFRNGAPFKDWVLPAAMERVRRKLAGADDGNRQMVDILTAVLTDGLPAVETACAEAIAHGVHSADVVLNILARQRDPGPPATILTPAALTLRHAPVADCARYDNLRRTI